MIWTMFLCNVAGFVIWMLLPKLGIPGIVGSQGIEFVNPIYLYKTVRVNWFGAIFLAIVYSAMCPIGAMIYWLYKFCTVGRD